MANEAVLYLIDSHALAYRQYFAFQKAEMSTSEGESVGAVFGFTRSLLDILIDIRPKYLAACFDAGLSGRDEVYTEYKATREKMPEGLEEQMKRIHQVVRAFNIPLLTLDGYEADDVIGTIARQAEERELNVHIITGDKDLLQLLSHHVKVQLSQPNKRGSDKVYDVAAFIEQYQIRPDQLVDLKALMGDSSDNIPGIHGIGEKTGTSLLLEYETLDGIYEHIEELKGAKKEKLVGGKANAYLSQKLARIRRDLPLELRLEDCVAHDFDVQEVGNLFRELEFRSLFDRLENNDVHQLPLFGGNDVAQDEGAPAPETIVETIIVDSKAALDALVETLGKAEAIVWDVETTSTDQMSAELVGIALAVNGERGYYVPVGHKAGTQIELGFVLDALEGPLTDPAIPKYAHNAVYDLVVMQNYLVDVHPVTFDTMVAEWLRDPISKFLGLKNFARQYLKVSMQDIEELIGNGKNQRTMREVSIERVAPYAAADAAITYQAVQYLRERLQADEIEDLLGRFEMPIVPVIAEMERNGVLLDVDYLSELSQRLDEQLAALEREIYSMGGVGAFNINSPKQLNEVLFDQLGLSVEGLKKTTHGYSTDAATMESLASEHPIVAKILDYRELAKLNSTYVDALPALVNPRTGRVHTSYNQTGTSTGRFSSSNPNLQNIPIRTDIGREVRRAFIASEGCQLLAVDYSQIELRVMAHISGDETLKNAFAAGQDIHRATAAVVFEVDPDAVTFQQRSFAKRVNFGLMYGMGAFRLARDSELTLAEANEFIDRYFERLPGVRSYIEKTQDFATKHGYVQTLDGRKRHFPNLKGGGSGRSAAAEMRAAINMPIQGTAADILKLAMIQLYDELQSRQSPARLILQVHDELVLEVPDDALAETAALVVTTMEQAYKLDVPLVANAEVGRNWRDMEKANVVSNH